MTSLSSGQCAFCGERFSNLPTPIPVAYGAPSEHDREAIAKLKPLRWRFLTNQSPRIKFMCTACAEKRQVPHQQGESPISSWPPDGRGLDRAHGRKPHQREEKDVSQHKLSGRTVRFEHLEPHDKVRQQQRIQSMPQSAQGRRVKLCEQQPERCDRRKHMGEQPTSDGRKQRSTQALESHQAAPRRHSLQQHYASRRVSKESVMQSRLTNTIEMATPTSAATHGAFTETSTRPRRASCGHLEPRESKQKGQRLSSTADILGMSRALELPPNYFDRSSSSPKLCSSRSLERDPLGFRRTKSSGLPEASQNRRRAMTSKPQVERRKHDETEEERQRRRSASYARMLLRMQRHYDAVQLNGSEGPATAPPRRIRTKRHAKSDAVCDVKDNPATFIIDLDYLRVYKDAR